MAEILTVPSDGRTRNVSLLLYDLEWRESFVGPNNIPAFVDCRCSEFELYKRADDTGDVPLVPPDGTP